MWLVYDNDEGVLLITDNYEEAIKEYEKQKERVIDYVRGEGEFSTDEQVILAKVENILYSYDTKQPVIECDDEGDEIESKKDTYWDFKEDIYK